MNNKETKPYGLWPSAITAEGLAGNIRIEDAQITNSGILSWLESVDGKTSLMVQMGSDAPKRMATGYKVGGGVGYGGGDYTITDKNLVFVSKNRLYKQNLTDGFPEPITPEVGECASPVISPDGSQVLYVSSIDRKDSLAVVSITGNKWPTQLSTGADFYMQPAWHPTGKFVAWVEWDHPEMPWDGCRLMLAELDGEQFVKKQHIFGTQDCPVFQPSFSPDGRSLAFLANDGELDSIKIFDIVSSQISTIVTGRSMIEPAWVQGLHSIAWGNRSDCIYYLVNNENIRSVEKVTLTTKEITLIDTNPYTWIKQLSVGGEVDSLLYIASSPKIGNRVVINHSGSQVILKRATPEDVPEGYLSDPKAIEWQASDGSIVHGLYYAPLSPNFVGNGLPPAIISVHGGPTSARVWEYSDQALYFTSRGYAYMEVNHRGSTGYGRKYMLKLRKNWGKIDVEDAAGGAKALAELGLADSARMVVMGGSAGGYTTLNALIQYPGVFKAGINFYGVANLFDFLIGTHKFEERYNDSLVGTLPEAAKVYKEWSPVFHAEKIKDPVAVFQGEIDKVVPREHSDQIVSILKANKVPHIYKLYPGEGHGFRKAETIADFFSSIDNFIKTHVLF